MPDKQIERLESDVRTLIDFYHAYVRADAAMEAWRRGGQYMGDRAHECDIAAKVLGTFRLEVEKIAEAMKKEQEVASV
jgi:hypothetical protein